MNRRRVLIETSWNVKKIMIAVIFFEVSSINRNIVECKDCSHWCIVHNQIRINRNIVECKDCSHWCIVHNQIVLIETSWNVKFRCGYILKRGVIVLIETSWNVKVSSFVQNSNRTPY